MSRLTEGYNKKIKNLTRKQKMCIIILSLKGGFMIFMDKKDKASISIMKIIGVSLIIINNNLSELMTVIVLLHELGHAILKHPTKDISFMKDNFFGFSNRLENEANLFLAEFLFNYVPIEEYCIGKEEEKALMRLAELRSRFEK